MKPILLRIMGINSFLEEQKIDFSSLTEVGLFGIFGATGSGKSSILDALTLALYDKIARDTGKNRDFINKETDTAFVSFEFHIATGQMNKTFVSERFYKRNDKESCQATKARFYEKKSDGKIEILADKPSEVTKEAVRILGLSYMDFSRSVVLPQGKFSDFLVLTGKDRRDMLERIFRLEAFGTRLAKRIQDEFLAQKEILTVLIGKLELYQNVSSEALLDEEKKLGDLKQKLTSLNQEWEVKNSIWQKKKELMDIILEREKFQKEWDKLEHDKDNRNKNGQAITLAEKSGKAMPFLKAWKEAQTVLNELRLLEKQANILWQKAERETQSAEINHSVCFNKKNEHYDDLLKKEGELIQASVLLNEIKLAEQDRDFLLKQFQVCDNQRKELQKQLDGLLEQKKNLLESLESILNEKQQYHVDTAFSQSIDEGAELEKKLAELSRQLNLGKRKLEENQSSLHKEIKKREDSFKIFQKMQIEKQELEENIHLFLESKPDMALYSIAAQTEISIIASRKQAEEASKRLVTFNSEKKDLIQKEDVLRLKCLELEQALTHKMNEHEILIKKIRVQELSNMAQSLAEQLKDGEACPVCGSKTHPSLSKQGVRAIESQVLENKESLELEILQYTNQITPLKLELEKIFLKKEQIELQTKEISDLLMEKSIAEWIFCEEEAKQKKEQISVSIEKFEKEKETKHTIREELNQKISDLSQKLAAFEEGQKHLTARINELEEEGKALEQEKKDISISVKVKSEECKITGSFVEEQQKLFQAQNKRMKLENEEKIVRTKIEKTEQNKESISFSLTKEENEILIIKTQGLEKRAIIDEKREKIKTLAGENDPVTQLEETRKFRHSLVTKEEEARKKFESCQSERQNKIQELLKVGKERETYEKLEEKHHTEFENKKMALGFHTKQEIETAYLPDDEISCLTLLCQEYDRKKENIRAQLDRLDEKIDGAVLTNEELLEASEVFQAVTVRKEEITGSYAVQIQLVETMTVKLLEAGELKKEADRHNHSLSILDDLQKLIRGNRFVEYIALKQLEYITLEASKRLKQITRGRYALELSGGDFIMRDDFNGGVRRKPSTLSGGETFLTSFCLALALSSKIQMKNQALLQFFFLDEGFGTLDNVLLDVVMTSLERLNQERLSVGIISHVEELKARVPRKLIVKAAVQGFGGSKVNLE